MLVSDNIKIDFLYLTNIPMSLVDEPIWSDRLKTLGFYSVWEDYVKEIQVFHKESEYFSYLQDLLNSVFNHIQNNDHYKEAIQTIPKRNGFKKTPISALQEENIGKWFVQIDIKNAWFSCLSKLCKDCFYGQTDWKKFLQHFTNLNFILNSKRFGISVFYRLGVEKISPLYINRTLELADKLEQEIGRYPDAVVMDEITYSVEDEADGKDLLNRIEPFLSKDLQYHKSLFQLEGIQIPELGNRTALIYYKDGTRKSLGIKSIYKHIVDKKLNGIQLTEQDFIV